MSESRRGYKLARSSLLVSTPQSRLTPCQLPVRGAFWGTLCAKIYELTLWLEQGRLTHCRSQFSLFLPVLRFAYSSTGRAQLRTSRSDRFNGVTGGAGGPKGRNRNLPRPPLQKSITSSLLFPVPSASLQGRWQRGCRGCRGRSLRPRRWRAPVRRPPECRRPRI